MTIEITLPQPKFDTVQKTLHLRRISRQIQTGDALASIAIPLRVSRRATVTILSHDDANVSVSKLDLTSAVISDVASDGKRGAAVHRRKPATAQHHGIGYASLTFMGTMRGLRIFRSLKLAFSIKRGRLPFAV